MSVIEEMQTEGLCDDSLVKTVDELKSSFDNLATKTYKILVAERKFTVSFLRSCFSSFPSTRLHEHKEFLDKYLLRVECEMTADDHWMHLSSYWNFLNYGLLKFISSKIGRASLIEDMGQFEEKLIKFCENVYLPEMASFDTGIQTIYSKNLSMRFSEEASKIKLIQVKYIEDAFIANFKLPKLCGLLLKSVSSSGAVTWSVPTHYCHILKWRLSICDKFFFEKQDIKSVRLDGENCYHKGSDRIFVNPANEVAGKTAITKDMFETEDMLKKVLVSSPPFTVTQLCSAYVCRMLTQYLAAHPVHGKKNMVIHSVRDLPKNVRSQYFSLCREAHHYFTLFDYFGKYDRVNTLGLGHQIGSEEIEFFDYKVQQFLAAKSLVASECETMEYSEGLMELDSEYFPYFIAGYAGEDFKPSIWEEYWNTGSFCMNLLLYEANSPSLVVKTYEKCKLCYDDQNKFSVGLWSLDDDKAKDMKECVNAYTFGYVAYFHSGSCKVPEAISLDHFVRGLVAASEYVFDGKYPLDSLELEMAVYYNTSNLCAFTKIPYLILNKVTMLSLLLHPSSYGSKEITNDFTSATQTEAIADILEHHSKGLVELKLFMSGKSAWDEAVMKGLRRNTTLMVLKIEGRIIFESTSGFWEFLKNDLISLRELEFNSCGIGDAACIEIARMLQVNRSLTKLIVHENHGIISCECLKVVAEALHVNRSLKVLHLNDCKIVDLGACELGRMLSNNSSLESLSLINNLIGDDGVKGLSEGLALNKKLFQLNLTSNMITDTTTLAGALEVNGALRSLNISANSVSDVSALAKSLEDNSTLMNLNLSENELNSDSSQVLIDALLVNSTLEIVDCTGNRNISFHSETLQQILATVKS